LEKVKVERLYHVEEQEQDNRIREFTEFLHGLYKLKTNIKFKGEKCMEII
jgi:hypothetical protein